MSTFIACPEGNVNGSHPLAHRLTAGQIERLVYTLSAALVDEANDANPAPEDRDHEESCPLDVLAWSEEPECYLEHVEGRIEQRREATASPS